MRTRLTAPPPVPGPVRLAVQPGLQVALDHVGRLHHHLVGAVLDDAQLGVGDRVVEQEGDVEDLAVVAVDEQRRHGEPGQVVERGLLGRPEVGRERRTGDQLLAVGDQAAQAPGGLLGHEPAELGVLEAGDDVLEVGDHLLRPVLGVGLGLDEDQARHPLGAPGGGRHGQRAAEAVAHQVDRLGEAEGVEDADEVVDRVLQPVAGGRAVAGAVAPQVVTDDRVLPGRHRGERVIEGRDVVDDQAVEEHHRRPLTVGLRRGLGRPGGLGAALGRAAARSRPQAHDVEAEAVDHELGDAAPLHRPSFSTMWSTSSPTVRAMMSSSSMVVSHSTKSMRSP